MMGTKNAQSWTRCLAVLAATSLGARCKCLFPCEGWERLRCWWSILGLQPPGTAAPRNCSCCPPPLVLAAPTPSCIPHQAVSDLALLHLAKLHPLLLLFPPRVFPCVCPGLLPVAALRLVVVQAGAGSKLWLLCKSQAGDTLSPGTPLLQRPPCLLQLRHGHGRVQLTPTCGARLPGDRCHGTGVTLDVHPMVLAAQGTL